jgi:hypothetical protein
VFNLRDDKVERVAAEIYRSQQTAVRKMFLLVYVQCSEFPWVARTRRTW